MILARGVFWVRDRHFAGRPGAANGRAYCVGSSTTQRLSAQRGFSQWKLSQWKLSQTWWTLGAVKFSGLHHECWTTCTAYLPNFNGTRRYVWLSLGQFWRLQHEPVAMFLFALNSCSVYFRLVRNSWWCLHWGKTTWTRLFNQRMHKFTQDLSTWFDAISHRNKPSQSSYMVLIQFKIYLKKKVVTGTV